MPGEELHERGLARAVGPDQPDPLPGADLEREVHEDRIAGVLPAKAVAEMRIMEVGSCLRDRVPQSSDSGETESASSSFSIRVAASGIDLHPTDLVRRIGTSSFVLAQRRFLLSM